MPTVFISTAGSPSFHNCVSANDGRDILPEDEKEVGGCPHSSASRVQPLPWVAGCDLLHLEGILAGILRSWDFRLKTSAPIDERVYPLWEPLYGLAERRERNQLLDGD